MKKQPNQSNALCSLLTLVAALAFVVIAPHFAEANGTSAEAPLAFGEAIAKENCSQCHAIGANDESAHEEAPLFRTLSQKYPIRNLEEALVEGIYSGHPDMPVFEFSPDEAEDLLSYLESIQEAN